MGDTNTQPVLVFDGDCSFCRLWVGYWKGLTGDAAEGGKVEYVPYQAAAERFPGVSIAEFRKAVHFFEGDRHWRGAEAVFHLFSKAPGHGWMLWLYSHLPGFALVTEWLYRVVAANRNAGYRVTKLLWGDKVQRPRYSIASALFVRALAIVYLIAFVSFGQQEPGLIGEQGIQPIAEYLNEVSREFGSAAFWHAPTIFWWVHGPLGLGVIAWSGAVLAAVAALARPHTAGQRAAFAVVFFYYLSIVHAGQIFMTYQWDFLLLEVGFLVLFLKPAFTRTWLFHWLLFRLMFESGAVKLLSHDLSWSSFTALAVHYQTQPLPTPVAWYMMQAPLWFQKASTVFVLAIELVFPFLIFGPPRLKRVAAAGLITLQVLILLTGNYTFFNLLTIALCLLLLDDSFFAGVPRFLSFLFRSVVQSRPGDAQRSNPIVSFALVLLVSLISLTQLAGMFEHEPPRPLRTVAAAFAPFGIVNEYGLFASMTTSRPEISIEGSNDAVEWQPYVFRYKPGPLNRAPRWVAPMQPRLDWQMWFAALGGYRENPWLLRFMKRLLEGSKPVLQLLETDPFHGAPPKYIRAMTYEYRFSTFDERRRTGAWWVREFKGAYFPPVSLRAR